MKKMRFYSILLIAIGIIPFLLANLLGNFQENFFEEPHEPLPSSPSSLKTVWYRTWGGLENDLAMELAIDSFDNIYLSGYIRDNETGELDRVCIVKYNTTGDLQWNRTWGEDFTFTIRPLIDNHNNIYIAGTTKNETGSTLVIYLLKFNNIGDLLWENIWSGNGSSFISEIALDSLNNIYLTGNTPNSTDSSSDIFLLKFNSSGYLEWNHTWGIGSDYAHDIAIDTLNNIYITGYTDRGVAKSRDLNIFKYKIMGHLQWRCMVNVSDFSIDTSLVLDSLDNVFVAFSNYMLGNYYSFLMKYDNAGNQLWNRTWQGGMDTLVLKIAVDSSDNVYIAGDTREGEHPNYRSDMFLVKYSNLGMRVWNHTWDKTEDDEVYAITTDSMDNIYLAGGTRDVDSNIAILKYDSHGSLISYTDWGGDEVDTATSIALDSSENIYISGFTGRYTKGDIDMLLIKLTETPSKLAVPGYDVLLLMVLFTSTCIIAVIARWAKKVKRSLRVRP